MASAAIVAGGRASRFDGRDRSALVVGGHVNAPGEYDEIEALAAGHER